MRIRRALWFSIGLLSLALGGIGIVLPLLPTTPFILVAAFAFSRSSQRWHNWLLSHPKLGPMIKDWHEHGAIRRRVKLFALASMLLVFTLSLWLGLSKAGLTAQAAVLALCAVFILTRPEPPSNQ
ncbi:MAG: YbaN family protein [Granulosicoccaceae bacterium]